MRTIEYKKVIERTEQILEEQGCRLESRQIRALAKALVEEVNKVFNETIISHPGSPLH